MKNIKRIVALVAVFAVGNQCIAGSRNKNKLTAAQRFEIDKALVAERTLVRNTPTNRAPSQQAVQEFQKQEQVLQFYQNIPEAQPIISRGRNELARTNKASLAAMQNAAMILGGSTTTATPQYDNFMNSFRGEVILSNNTINPEWFTGALNATRSDLGSAANAQNVPTTLWRNILNHINQYAQLPKNRNINLFTEVKDSFDALVNQFFGQTQVQQNQLSAPIQLPQATIAIPYQQAQQQVVVPQPSASNMPAQIVPQQQGIGIIPPAPGALIKKGIPSAPGPLVKKSNTQKQEAALLPATTVPTAPAQQAQQQGPKDIATLRSIPMTTAKLTALTDDEVTRLFDSYLDDISVHKDNVVKLREALSKADLLKRTLVTNKKLYTQDSFTKAIENAKKKNAPGSTTIAQTAAAPAATVSEKSVGASAIEAALKTPKSAIDLLWQMNTRGLIVRFATENPDKADQVRQFKEEYMKLTGSKRF